MTTKKLTLDPKIQSKLNKKLFKFQESKDFSKAKSRALDKIYDYVQSLITKKHPDENNQNPNLS